MKHIVNKYWGLTAAIAVSFFAIGCGKEKAADVVSSEPVAEESQVIETEEADNTLHFVDARGEWHDVTIRDDWEKHDYELTAFLHDNDKLIYENNTEYLYRLGVDVSKYQGSVDWEAVKSDGYEFAFVRIGYRGYGEAGKLCEDEKAIEHLKGAIEAGLDVGVYFFSQAISEEEAVEEAQYAMSILSKNGFSPENLTLPIVFDPESILDDDSRTDHVTGAQFTKNTVAFSKAVEAGGYKSMIYCNMMWEAYMLDMGALAELPVWYADYEAVPQTPYRFEFWQYSETAKVNGIADAVDVNIQLIKK